MPFRHSAPASITQVCGGASTVDEDDTTPSRHPDAHSAVLAADAAMRKAREAEPENKLARMLALRNGVIVLRSLFLNFGADIDEPLAHLSDLAHHVHDLTEEEVAVSVARGAADAEQAFTDYLDAQRDAQRRNESKPNGQGTKAPELNKLHWHFHGDPDVSIVRAWLVHELIPEVGAGLISGQWGTY